MPINGLTFGICQKIGVSPTSGALCTLFKLKWAHGGNVLSVSCRYLASLTFGSARSCRRSTCVETREWRDRPRIAAKATRYFRFESDDFPMVVRVYCVLCSPWRSGGLTVDTLYATTAADMVAVCSRGHRCFMFLRVMTPSRSFMTLSGLMHQR